jgi:ABC-type Na+ efflux pump permease subunit
MWAIHATYILFFLMCSWSLWSVVQEYITPSAVQIAAAVVPLLFLSLVLVNAQAISSMTSERDGGTFDLLLVSDISPKEFVVGKLVGIFYNMKWCVGLPLLIFFVLYFDRCIDFTPLVFLVVGCTMLFVFVAMIGLHIGMNNENTRTAAAMSLGTVFFLFVGITACIWIMVVFSGSFEAQLQPFVAFMVGGGAGLYVTLGGRNPSRAIAWAAFMLPPATFYIITSLLHGSLHLGFLVGIIAYGFTTLAMLIPAIAEFDIATGRTAD